MTEQVLRQHAEQQFAAEFSALKEVDNKPRPENWELSPWAVRTYLMGGVLPNKFEITPKYIGDPRLMEVAISTLTTDRALLLYGVPGTAKSYVSEHITAAISGDSTRVIQGTAGTSEEAIRYGWNYAQLLAKGPSREALVESPMIDAMQRGKIARIEELTRIPSDVQDTLITILSEKHLPVPELNSEIAAVKGFNVIATANNRDKGVNELSSALQRRFNTVILPTPATIDKEIEIVGKRVNDLGSALDLPKEMHAAKEIERVVTIFRELRSGMTIDQKSRLKIPSGTLSTAEAISVMNAGISLSYHFGEGTLDAADIASGLTGAVIKDPVQDPVVWKEYLETVIKERAGWGDLYQACRALV
ncbi:ATPase [Corallincola luteus]|uniref:ATPase n=1 Tax=Corallincola luteus TaxID=1775177 RepID=A0ABY2AIH0_9GAMM|nr:AAA family ATPase [Corallincola luteus]TCI01706.1 ATPase [Corallincola luteus]